MRLARFDRNLPHERRCAGIRSGARRRRSAHGSAGAGRRAARAGRRAHRLARRALRRAATLGRTRPVFELERAAARYFGVHTYAAHVNGLVRGERRRRMWLARRSATKAIDPGHARQPGRRRHRRPARRSRARSSRSRGRKPASPRRSPSTRGARGDAHDLPRAARRHPARDDLRARPVAARRFRPGEPGRRGGRAPAR